MIVSYLIPGKPIDEEVAFARLLHGALDEGAGNGHRDNGAVLYVAIDQLAILATDNGVDIRYLTSLSSNSKFTICKNNRKDNYIIEVKKGY